MSMNVLLVEDDKVLAGFIASELSGFGHQVTQVGDGPQAIGAVARASFDAIVLDRMLPTTDGLQVLRHIRAEGIQSPVILLTALGRLTEKVQGLEEGADDYLVKPIDPLELNARLHAVQRRRSEPASDGDTMAAGEVTVSPAAHRAWCGGAPVDLSRVELGILTELVRHAGGVVTRAMLYEQLWGADFNPSTNIADANIRRLRQKLVAASGTDPILTIRGVGYKLKV